MLGSTSIALSVSTRSVDAIAKTLTDAGSGFLQQFCQDRGSRRAPADRCLTGGRAHSPTVHEEMNRGPAVNSVGPDDSTPLFDEAALHQLSAEAVRYQRHGGATV